MRKKITMNTELQQTKRSWQLKLCNSSKIKTSFRIRNILYIFCFFPSLGD